jgi:hypothetical protein
MIKIEYPDKKPATKIEDNKELIFCIIRKRWYIITPEEWVRQNFLLYLIEVLKYPASLIAVERQISLGEIKKRFDIIFYQNDEPFMIVECKEMNVPLTENVMRQVLNYNATTNAAYIVITNGSYCMAFKKKGNSMLQILKMPNV